MLSFITDGIFATVPSGKSRSGIKNFKNVPESYHKVPFGLSSSEKMLRFSIKLHSDFIK